MQGDRTHHREHRTEKEYVGNEETNVRGKSRKERIKKRREGTC